MSHPIDHRLDRPDTALARRQTPEHVEVAAHRRGALNLDRDTSQHRRFTALYDDLQN